GTGIAANRRPARRGAGAPSDDPAAARRPCLSGEPRRQRTGDADRRLPRLSPPAPAAAAGAGMGDPLARNASPGAVAAGAVPPRFPYRELPGGWGRADRHPRLGIRRLGRSRRGYRLVLLQGLALREARS